MSTVDLTAKIPNNVALHEDKKLQRALEHWQPGYIEWWQSMGPSDFATDQIYLRTAVGVGKGGWANFDYVKMPDYRWGIFLAEPEADRQTIAEPASVEQQRLLGHTAPSLYDLRNLFQVNVEEGRHLWAMVYLLHRYFGSDGRDEAEDLLRRRSGNPDNPRILQAFNKPVNDWFTFFCFTTFTDRDGKYQLSALAESGFDPLARSTQFMLTEEAHHLSVGENGVGRTIERTAQLLKEGQDPRAVAAIPLDVIQKYVNEWASASYDLFGGEDSTNAANYFGAGLKGRYRESDGLYKDPKALDQVYQLAVSEDGRSLSTREVPLRRAMNALLLDAYHADCTRIVERWNRTLKRYGVETVLTLPSLRFNRHVGVHAERTFDPQGNPVSAEEFERRRGEWLPTAADYAHVTSCMRQVLAVGKIANWLAPPAQGINEKPFEYEYVKFH